MDALPPSPHLWTTVAIPFAFDTISSARGLRSHPPTFDRTSLYLDFIARDCGRGRVALRPGDTLSLRRSFILAVLLQTLAWSSAIAQTAQPQFGGTYAELDERRQRLVDGWVVRLEKTTGQKIEPAPLYDDVVSLSSKTTFVAVTHALMTTRLTDRAGADLGDALALVERIDVVRGEVTGERGDHQFRIYGRLTADAFDKLSRSTAVQACLGQLRLSQGISHQLSRTGRDAVDPGLDRGRPAKRRRRRRLPGVVFSCLARQWSPDGVELRCPRRQQLRQAPQSVDGFPELVAGLLRRSARASG